MQRENICCSDSTTEEMQTGRPRSQCCWESRRAGKQHWSWDLTKAGVGPALAEVGRLHQEHAGLVSHPRAEDQQHSSQEDPTLQWQETSRKLGVRPPHSPATLPQHPQLPQCVPAAFFPLSGSSVPSYQLHIALSMAQGHVEHTTANSCASPSTRTELGAACGAEFPSCLIPPQLPAGSGSTDRPRGATSAANLFINNHLASQSPHPAPALLSALFPRLGTTGHQAGALEPAQIPGTAVGAQREFGKASKSTPVYHRGKSFDLIFPFSLQDRQKGSIEDHRTGKKTEFGAEVLSWRLHD